VVKYYPQSLLLLEEKIFEEIQIKLGVVFLWLKLEKEIDRVVELL
jgi:hypothetical protein